MIGVQLHVKDQYVLSFCKKRKKQVSLDNLVLSWALNGIFHINYSIAKETDVNKTKTNALTAQKREKKQKEKKKIREHLQIAFVAQFRSAPSQYKNTTYFDHI